MLFKKYSKSNQSKPKFNDFSNILTSLKINILLIVKIQLSIIDKNFHPILFG